MSSARTGRWVAAVALLAAAVACALAYSRVLGSCDSVTALPALMCNLRPTHWVSKSYYPPEGLFGSSRKARFGSGAEQTTPRCQPESLTPELDAASDFGENANGSVRQSAGGAAVGGGDHLQQPRDGGDQQGRRQDTQKQTAQPDEQPHEDPHDHAGSGNGKQPAEELQQPQAEPAARGDTNVQPGSESESGQQRRSGPNSTPGEQHAGESPPAEPQPEDEVQPVEKPAQLAVEQPDAKTAESSGEQSAPDEQGPGASSSGPPEAEQPRLDDSSGSGGSNSNGGRGNKADEAAGDIPDSAQKTGGEEDGSEAGSKGEKGRLPLVTEWVDQQEIMWERPRGEPKGVFLALNGCNHGPSGWWDPQPECQHCLGLPEEKNIVRVAVERGYVAVALAVVQQREKMRCWANLTPPNWNTDMKSTVKSVKTLAVREGWQGLPLYAWGGSAGGSFVARLPFYLPMKGIMVQLKGVGADEVEADPLDPDTGEAWGYPKVVYAYNRRDPVATERAVVYTDALMAKGIDYVLLGADPTPLDPKFFSRRIEEINATVSRQLYKALKDGGVLDAHDYITADPRTSDTRWQALLTERVPYALTVELRKFVSPIFEELNWAFSNHQGISDSTEAAFKFFESGERPDEHMLENAEFWELQKQQEAAARREKKKQETKDKKQREEADTALQDQEQQPDELLI